jgi:hypothetical protein
VTRVGHAADLNRWLMIFVRILCVPGAGLEPARPVEGSRF